MENNDHTSIAIGTAHSIGDIAVIDEDELSFVHDFAYASMTRISLYRWTTEESTILIVKKSLHDGSIPQRDDRRLEEEMMILTQLSHDNIVKIYGVIQSPSSFGLAMEYYELGSYKKIFTTLWEKSTRTTTMNNIVAPLKIQMISEIISAMVYLHNRTPEQVLHLDLRPANILLDSQLHVKICDFGLSRMKTVTMLRSRTTSADPQCGNPCFISPERLRDLKTKPTTKDDVYSFGITSWEIVSDCNPYDEQVSTPTDFHLLEEHIIFNNLRPDKSLIPDVYPQELIQIIEKAWTMEPTARPCFGDLNNEIERIKHNFPNFDKAVDEARRRILTLHDMVNPGALRTRRASLNDVERNKTRRTSDNIDIEIPNFRNITVPKRHSWNDMIDAVQQDDNRSEHEPLISNYSVQKPFLSTTKSLVAVSFLLSVAAAIGVLIWWEVKSKDCTTIEAPTHGFINCTSELPIKCEFTCQDGYKLIGKEDTVCNNGYWNDDVPKCLRVCENVPEITHGKVSCSNEEFVNSTCETTCTDNHVVNGNATVHCNSNGNWSSSFPNCECAKCSVGFSCGDLISWEEVHRALAGVSYEDHETIHYGGHVFTCDTGIYELKHHCRCENSKHSVNCQGYGSASGAAFHSAAQLIRDMMAQGMYQKPCDADSMPQGCG